MNTSDIFFCLSSTEEQKLLSQLKTFAPCTGKMLSIKAHQESGLIILNRATLTCVIVYVQENCHTYQWVVICASWVPHEQQQ